MAHNHFYQEFDLEVLEPGQLRPVDYRTPFQIDRDRLIHSGAFRRLQSKTQVFVSGQYDFYRTRLTHTIEVAQVGRSICAWLKASGGPLQEDFFICPDLVEAACLAHDLGHPPFGHTGERTLNELLSDYGGFEGNAQTLRLLCHTLYHGERGLNPTRATVDAVLKYKTLHRELVEAQGRPPANHFVYDEQQPLLEAVHGGEAFPSAAVPGKARDRLRSIECQIMDWADDTAYSLNDLADGAQAGFVSVMRLERWAGEQVLEGDEAVLLDELLAMLRENKVEGRLGRQIGRFIQAVSLREVDGWLAARSHRYRFELVVEPEVRRCCAFYKRIAVDLIFRSHRLQQLDLKADRFLRELWREIWEQYREPGATRFDLLPREVVAKLREQSDPRERARWVADHLGGMSDAFALRTYRRLFDPGFGSLSDWF